MNNGSCRIIGGRWRGRVIRFEDAEGLRPTTDRIRETLFNWLQPYIYQSRCLDVFAGSGILGLEALSRGASKSVFLDSNIKTVRRLKENISTLDAQGTTLIHQDALAWLQSEAGKPGNDRFDLVFLDPPFHSELLAKSCELLNSSGCLAEDAIIYVEHNIAAAIELPENWFVIKEKKAGQVAFRLFENRAVDES